MNPNREFRPHYHKTTIGIRLKKIIIEKQFNINNPHTLFNPKVTIQRGGGGGIQHPLQISALTDII